MWECPKCKRKFKVVNQGHYCGEKPKTIDEYIKAQDEDKVKDLRNMYDILRKALPEAEERISWSMPTLWKNHNILHFAASKSHIGFYPGPQAVEEFAEQLSEYKTDKGTIRIPYGKIDAELIEKIAKWCWDTGNHDIRKIHARTCSDEFLIESDGKKWYNKINSYDHGGGCNEKGRYR